jgi:hypothetical protein
MTSDYNERTKTWAHAWDVKLTLSASSTRAGDCFVEIAYPVIESAYALIKDNSSLVVKKRKARSSGSSDDSSEDNDSSNQSHRGANCPSFDCQDEPRRSTSPGGPDDTSDEPSREDDDSTFDGGGYSSNNGL